MDGERKRVWLIPALIVIIGIAVLFIENYQEVTERTNQKWSSHVQTGISTTLRPPSTHTFEDGKEDGVQENIYDVL